MKRIIFVLTVGTIVATLLATAAAPAMADDDFSVLNDEFGFDFNDNVVVEEADVVDDVDVSDPFIVDNEVCVDVVVTFEDGSTDTDRECQDLEDLFF